MFLFRFSPTIFLSVIFLFLQISSSLGQSTSDSLVAVNLTAINSTVQDIFPVLSPNGHSLYFTRQYHNLPSKIFEADRNLQSNWDTPVEWKSIELFRILGSMTFDDSGTIYIAGRVDPSVIPNDCDIFQLKNGKLSNIGKPINTIKWESQPCVTPDGKTLYFASNQQSSFNDLRRAELYVSHLQHDGTWTQPNNLGPKINEGNYTATPFITPDNSVLFFSSRVGDAVRLFMALRTGESDSSWSFAAELPYPFNADGSSICPYLSRDTHEFYFSSNRPGGQGGFDLYEVRLPNGLRDLYRLLRKSSVH